MNDEFILNILNLVYHQGGFFDDLKYDTKGYTRKECNSKIIEVYKNRYNEDVDIRQLAYFWKEGLFRKGSLGYDVFLTKKGFNLLREIEERKTREGKHMKFVCPDCGFEFEIEMWKKRRPYEK